MKSKNKNNLSYLQRCLDLAARGFSNVAPNPQVGAVLVNNDRIISEGYHHNFGGHHAEVDAIQNAIKGRISDFSDTELYVSLEPCNHHGKTPPCTSLIMDHGIKKVYVATLDPAPKMSGKSFSVLNKNGVQAENYSLADGKKLISDFAKFQGGKRPYVILKWAESADGFIGDRDRPVLISNSFSKHLVHRLRARVKGILVGTNTVITDDPTLTTRQSYGPNPLTMVIDNELILDNDLSIFQNEIPPKVFHHISSDKTGYNKNADLIAVEEDDFVPRIMRYCINRGISSLLVEGGAKTLDFFLKHRFWDEIWRFRGSKIVGSGVEAPGLIIQSKDRVSIGNDILDRYYC